MKIHQIYPISPNNSFKKKVINSSKILPIFCPICGSLSIINQIDANNLRESCICYRCKSTNRQRQIALLLCKHLKIPSLIKINNIKNKKVIYNTESSGPIHQQLLKYKHYICSEYFGNKFKSGAVVNNILNEDLTNLSFRNKSIDVVLSSDVFEHISNPYKAHGEVYRVLKKNGCHIFTVPFYQSQYLDENRATVNKRGEIRHFKTPIYHEDGIRPEEGILVYNIFSLEMLIKLNLIGFKTAMYNTHNPYYGILGDNAVVFLSKK